MHNETTPAPNGKICSGCRFFLSYTRTNTNVHTCSCGETHEATSEVRVHYCRRFPRPEPCEPDGWCGEFQPIGGSLSATASNEGGTSGGQEQGERRCATCRHCDCPTTLPPCSECFEEWSPPKWEPKAKGATP
jgi:LSD1 subclass zinc finger protein